MKHVHFLGIAGTFMGSLALIAQSLGFRVTGADHAIYPPMSTLLAAAGIEVIEGFGKDQVNLAPDCFIVGNVMSRGKQPILDEILERGLPYTSGPAWLYEHVLKYHWVLAVAGTHGKTTTTSMLAWILEMAGLAPGFLIGGAPLNFPSSARLPGAPSMPPAHGQGYFVIEADEYDTAFFDKRSKFLHYQPRTAILNNLEFDHADIFADEAAIEAQFHYLLRTIAPSGTVIANQNSPAIRRVLERGCWSQQSWFSGLHTPADAPSFHHIRFEQGVPCIFKGNQALGPLPDALLGVHNHQNALAALLAAQSVGISAEKSLEALATFKGVKRRLEIRGVANYVTIIDDFAHHPTAIRLTLEAWRARMKEIRTSPEARGRLFAIVDPRSNTMKMGVLKNELPQSLLAADATWLYTHDLGWDPASVFNGFPRPIACHHNLQQLIDDVLQRASPGDSLLVMSNGGFGGIHEKLLEGLKKQEA